MYTQCPIYKKIRRTQQISISSEADVADWPSLPRHLASPPSQKAVLRVLIPSATTLPQPTQQPVPLRKLNRNRQTSLIHSTKPQSSNKMDQAKELLEMPREFLKDGRQFLTRCSKRMLSRTSTILSRMTNCVRFCSGQARIPAHQPGSGHGFLDHGSDRICG